MKAASIRSLALASLASLVMATSSSAVTILTFGQSVTGPGIGVIATAAGGTTTTLTTFSAADGSVPVSITNIGNTQLTPTPGPNQIISAFETFRNVVSSGPATSPNGDVRQTYAGTILFTSLPGGLGTNYLTATFTNAVLFGPQLGGNSATFSATDPPVTRVVFTSEDPRVLAAIAALGPNPLDAFGIGFADVVPGVNITGSTVSFNYASNGGTFSSTAAVPEPSGLVMAGTAMIASLGCIGWRRRQSSRA